MQQNGAWISSLFYKIQETRDRGQWIGEGGHETGNKRQWIGEDKRQKTRNMEQETEEWR